MDGGSFVDYRLPETSIPKRTRYSARVDAADLRGGPGDGRAAVVVVPGKPVGQPARRRGPEPPVRRRGRRGRRDPAARRGGVVATAARRRRSTWSSVRRRRGVLSSASDAHGPGPAGLGRPGAARGRACAGPSTCSPRRTCCPGAPESGLEQVSGSSYVVRGRVVDAREGRAGSSSTTASGSRCRPGRTGSAPTSATPPRSAARSASPRAAAAERLYIRLPSCQTLDDPLRSGQLTLSDQM